MTGIAKSVEDRPEHSRVAPTLLDTHPSSLAEDAHAPFAELLRRRIPRCHHVEARNVTACREVGKHRDVGVEKEGVVAGDAVDLDHERCEVVGPETWEPHREP